MGVKIAAISSYLPDFKYTNEDFYRDFPEAAREQLLKVGVQERHLAEKGETSSDLAVKAAEKLFSEHKIDRNSIDFLIYNANEQDYFLPPTSCVVHERLGLQKSCGTIDFNHGCSAYVYGLGIAKGFITTSGVKRVLYLTSSVLTKRFHPKDKSSRYIFGDAASATLLEYDHHSDIGPFEYGTDGKGFDKIIVRDGYERYPIHENSFQENTDEFGNISSNGHFRMDGVSVFLFSVRTVPAMIQRLMEKSGLQPEAIDLYVFHQPNVFLNETIRKKAGIPEDKFVHYMGLTGNTVQSTIPIALEHCINTGRLQRGMTVLLAGFGVGLSWSATVMRY
ncbi:MAG: ketoacyl-ACP synthase III [Bacteroidia bacterium]